MTRFSRRHEKLPTIPIVNLQKSGHSDNEGHMERQSVFPLETLCNHAIAVVV